AGIDADAVTGKNAVRRRLLQQRHFRSAQRYWQIRGDIRGDAEAMGVVDHSLDTQTVSQLQRWNVARLGQRAAERNRAFKLLIVVVRDVRARRGLKRYRPVHDGVI